MFRRPLEHNVPLTESEPMIRRLAEKIWTASRGKVRIDLTAVLKLKTDEFRILTRSHSRR
jgi:DNA polymerase-4